MLRAVCSEPQPVIEEHVAAGSQLLDEVGLFGVDDGPPAIAAACRTQGTSMGSSVTRRASP